MTGTHYVGICDHCRVIKQGFPSAEARDYWQAHHEEHEGADD